MRSVILLSVLALAACEKVVPISGASQTVAVENLAAKKTSGHTVEVLEVVDGDTFTFKATREKHGLFAELPPFKVRVRGIDTPEKGGLAKCKAERERAAAATEAGRALIVESGNVVVISNLNHDKYGGRIDADVKLIDGRNYAATMVSSGHARVYEGGRRQSWCG